MTTTKRIGRLLVYWLGFLWTSPNTLLGASFAVFTKLSGGSWRLVDGNLECSGRLLQRCFGLLNPSFDFGAITFGHVILGRNEAILKRFRRHEQVHVRQYRRWGPLFLPAYLAASAILWCRGRRPYLDNPFEVEAYREESA